MNQSEMKYEVTECGFTEDGLRVLAITDDTGSQVVVSDDQSPHGTHLLSKPLKNHETCIALAREVQFYGIGFYEEWGSPLGVFEFACILANQGKEKTECQL